MATRRKNNYNPMATVNQPRWYVVVDQFNALVEYERLAPGCNLWSVLREVMETRARRGWEIEAEDEPRFGSFFCRKDGVRLYITIRPTDPNAPPERYFSPYAPAGAAQICAGTADTPMASPTGPDAESEYEKAQAPGAYRHPD